MSGYEAVIGLEIHVQLATATKLFCGDLNEFDAPPNTRVCPVCLGLPGALPVVNGGAVRLALRAALGLGCEIHRTSLFARKHYFYPDLPKGYQITQFERPLATGGWLEAPGDGEGKGRVRIRRIHLEEDAGRSTHDRFPGRTAVDLNRAGVPLIEIVTEPDLRSPAQARAFLTRLKQVLEYLEVSDCDMEKGSLRVDANLSLRPAGDTELGTKTEVKNMNSFSNVGRALEFEAARQARVVAEGGRVESETLLWDADAGVARRMRSKEGTEDYRFFPDPDLPALVVATEEVDEVRRSLPELPEERAARFRTAYGLPAYDSEVLTARRATADYFEAAAASAGEPKAVSNWIMRDVLGWLNERRLDIEAFPLPAARLGELIGLVAAGTISSTAARAVFPRMVETGRAAADIVESEGLVQVSDDDRLMEWADRALEDHPEEAQRFLGGEEKLVGFFVGKVMQRSGGKADPKRAAELLRARSSR